MFVCLQNPFPIDQTAGTEPPCCQCVTSVLFKGPQKKTIIRLVHRTVGTMKLESGPSAGPGPEWQRNARQKARQKIMCHDKKYFVVHKSAQFTLRNDKFYFLSAFCRSQYCPFLSPPPERRVVLFVGLFVGTTFAAKCGPHRLPCVCR